ncbi:SDR family NAD(P)-dependent oxidoreductase [Janibacter indicus]
MSTTAPSTTILTGVSGDIGRAYLQAFVRAGRNVLATDLAAAAEPGEQAVREANEVGPGRAVFVTADVTSAADCARAVAVAKEEFGGADALVNNAAIYHGLGPKRSILELTEADWDKVLRVNVTGTWQMMCAAVPLLKESGRGRIVNIASVVTRNGATGFAHYVASKAAVEGLTRSAAKEFGVANITVNSVSPGLVDDSGSRAVNTDDYMQKIAATRAIPRAMEPEDLVSAVSWLTSEESGFVTGQTVIVDGGGIFA